MSMTKTEIMAGLFGLAIVGGVVLLPFSIANVPVGSRGVKTVAGKPTGEIYSEGLHLRMPFLSGNTAIEVRTKNVGDNYLAGSVENQGVQTITTASYHVDPSKVVEFYQGVSGATDQNALDGIIRARMQQDVKNVIAQYQADEVLQKTPEIRTKAEVALREDLKSFYIVLDSLIINDLDFLPAFNQSIEAKAKAEQDALAAKNKLEQTKYEAQQAIESAKGEAEALRIKGDALRSNPELIQLEGVKKWNGTLPQYMTGTTPFIKVN